MGVRIDISKCTACGSCLPVCPLGILQIRGGHNSIEPGCDSCGACEKVCMFDALIFEAEDESGVDEAKSESPVGSGKKG